MMKGRFVFHDHCPAKSDAENRRNSFNSSGVQCSFLLHCVR